MLVWLAATAVAFPLVGVACLMLSAYASSFTGIGASARELVLGAQTALWGIAMTILVPLVGRSAIGPLTAIRNLPALSAGVGLVLAIVVAYASAAEGRAGGVLDVDALGPVVLVPAALLAASTAQFALALSPPGAIRTWSFAAAVIGLVGLLLIVYSLATPAGPSTKILVAAAGVFILLLVGAAGMRAVAVTRR